MGKDLSPTPASAGAIGQPTPGRSSTPPQMVADVTGSVIDRAQRLQAPAVAKYVASLRKANPDASPAEIIAKLEKRYLAAVTGSGGAVGATAAVPGVGTVTALGAITGETAFFLEASALLALSIAEVHGIPVEDRERRRTLVLAVALGEEGMMALSKVVGTNSGTLQRLSAGVLPGVNIGALNTKLAKMFARKYALKRAPVILGKMLPAGIGAVVGAAGNRAIGKRVVHNARESFGPPPTHWVIDGELA